MNILMLPIFALALTSLNGASDWVPTFNDKPVPKANVQAINEALPSAAIVTPEKSRRVLIFSATAGFRHSSIPTAKMALAKLGEATGAYDPVVSDDPANFEPEALKTFDAVLLVSPTLDFFMPNKKQRKRFSPEEWDWLQARHNRLVDNLIDYVQQGGGLVGIHAATDACYGHQGYGKAMGAYFGGHPWTSKMNVTIVVEDCEHEIIKPVFAGMKDFQIMDEIYQFKSKPYSRDQLRVLLHLDPDSSDQPRRKPSRKDNDYAVCWVQSVGEGRVFYTSLGHREDIYSNPLMLKHYLAGIQFAAGDLAADTTPSSKLNIPNVSRVDGDWVSLFDGKTLNGWQQTSGKASYKVRDGAIVGSSLRKGGNSVLCTNETFGDFELEFEVKCDAINSGVQIRSLQDKDIGKGEVRGPQVEIEHSPGQSGFIYGAGYGGGWRSPEPRSKDAQVNEHNIFKNKQWNHYRVRAQGAGIQTWINDRQIAELHDPLSYQLFPRGFIGLQVHSHPVDGIEIEWRNIRIRKIK